MSQRNAQPQQPHIVHRPLVMMAFLNSFQLVSASHHGPWVGTEASNIQTKKDDTTRVPILLYVTK